MRIVSIGGGPAGLYAAILLRRASPSTEVTVVERNRPDDTFGFGVVFSDATLESLAVADPPSYREIERRLWHWDDIRVHVGGEVITSTGHGFCGLDRKELLSILQARCQELDVGLRFETEVDDIDAWCGGADLVLGADGVASRVRERFRDAFEPDVDVRPNRFAWFGTTYPFDAFTFLFRENEHGLWRVHAYRYREDASTFIVECTDDTWRRAGLQDASEDDTIAYLARVFERELDGHRLIKNRSIWRSFPTVRNRRWHSGRAVLVGDAAHTAHFSIGSGTKLAMEDGIALAEALAAEDDVRAALARYERARRPEVEKLQRAAQVSLEWFEGAERYRHLEPIQFAYSLLTRSLRLTHDNLRRRDPDLVRRVDAWFGERARASARRAPAPADDASPMFAPLELRGVVLENRVVAAPGAHHKAADGTPGDWHLVHEGSRARAGAGLVMVEFSAVCGDGRLAPGTPGLYNDDQARAWERVAAFVHVHTRSRIGIQIGHAGGRGGVGGDRIAASAIPYRDGDRAPRAAEPVDLERVREEFARAAERADAAGFDLVELQLADGTLPASFLSPLVNRRGDAWGGDLEARLRFPLAVVEAVREVWPARKPLAARIPGTDWMPDGLTGDDAVAIASALTRAGCDVICVTSGRSLAGAAPPDRRLVDLPFADRVRNEAGAVTVTSGARVRDVDGLLAAGRADLCALEGAPALEVAGRAAARGGALPR